MKKNIAIICHDKALSRSTAQLISQQLGMRFFDIRELFEFDHKPTTFKQIVTDYGVKYYRDKECSITKYASDFENIVLNLDSDILYKKNTLACLKENFVIVYLHISNNMALKIMSNEEYSCYKEKAMYSLTKEQLATRIQNIRAQADVEVNASSATYFKASSLVLRAIEKLYGVQ